MIFNFKIFYYISIKNLVDEQSRYLNYIVEDKDQKEANINLLILQQKLKNLKVIHSLTSRLQASTNTWKD